MSHVIAIDASASMKGFPVIDVLREYANAVHETDTICLILFDDEPDILVDEGYYTIDQLENIIENYETDSKSHTNIESALKGCMDILAKAPDKKRKLYLITDFRHGEMAEILPSEDIYTGIVWSFEELEKVDFNVYSFGDYVSKDQIEKILPQADDIKSYPEDALF